MRGFEKWLKDTGYASVEPVKSTPPVKVDGEPKEPARLEDADKILAAVRGPTTFRDRAFILTMLDTRARATEVLRLDVGNFDMAKARVQFLSAEPSASCRG